MSLTNVLQIVFFLSFGLTLFGLPFAMLVAQLSALVLGIALLIQSIKAS